MKIHQFVVNSVSVKKVLGGAISTQFLQVRYERESPG
jgi:hypothetical protein